ncbi:hypothetical protein BC938DRAFT_476619, partial [Jimgerdemannia flammicorona]
MSDAIWGFAVGIFALRDLVGDVCATVTARLGRREVLNALFVGGGVLMAFATTVAQFIVGCIVVGIASGLSSVVLGIYLAEHVRAHPGVWDAGRPVFWAGPVVRTGGGCDPPYNPSAVVAISQKVRRNGFRTTAGDLRRPAAPHHSATRFPPAYPFHPTHDSLNPNTCPQPADGHQWGIFLQHTHLRRDLWRGLAESRMGDNGTRRAQRCGVRYGRLTLTCGQRGGDATVREYGRVAAVIAVGLVEGLLLRQ